jgi:hypothetical protein
VTGEPEGFYLRAEKEGVTGMRPLSMAPRPPYDEAESDIAKGVKSDPARRTPNAQKLLTPEPQ